MDRIYRLKMIVLALVMLMLFACNFDVKPDNSVSATGVKATVAKVSLQASGMTTEQENITKRIEQENMPGVIKHLYVISEMSGQVIIYSTVKGKVTSSSKRLTPYTVKSMDGQYVNGAFQGMDVYIGGNHYKTEEVLQDDGTYGSSIPYLYWWDTKGQYHQHYVSGGQIIHIADKPMPVKSITINLEQD